MMLGGRRLWCWMGLLLVVAATAGGVAYIVYDFSHSRPQDSTSTLVQTLITVVTAGAGAALWLWTRVRTTGAAPLPLERAADELAEQLRQQWEQAAAEQRLIAPPPIPVRWRWSPRQVTGSRAEAVEGPYAPLTGMTAVTVEDLRFGALNDLVDVYGGLAPVSGLA